MTEALPPPPPPVPPPPPPPPPVLVSTTRWRDQRGLTLSLTICFGVMVALSVVLSIAIGNRISVVREIRAGHFGNTLQRAEDADDFVRGSAALFTMVGLVIAVLFIVWMFRTAKNNEALGRVGPRFGPGWSIGAWFIPIANFVIPVLIVQDLWRGSDAGAPRGDLTWRRSSGSALVGLWWTAWVLSSVRFFASGSSFGQTTSLDDIETSNTVALVAVVVTAIAAVFAVFVVRALSRRQLDTLRGQNDAYRSEPTSGQVAR